MIELDDPKHPHPSQIDGDSKGAVFQPTQSPYCFTHVHTACFASFLRLALSPQAALRLWNL